MGVKILVTDDEEVIRFAFQTFLANEGYEVVTAESLNSAIHIVDTQSLDLIFADILLGSDSGIDLLRHVKEKGLRCPVIMITGQPNIENASDSVRLGAFDYLPKPVKKEALLHATQMALNHKMLLDEKDAMNEEKEKYRRHLEAIFQSVGDGIVTVDQNLKIIEMNNAVHDICQLSRIDWTGKKFEAIASHCAGSCLQALQETLSTGKTVKEFRIECGNEGSNRQVVVVSSSPLISENEDAKGAVLVIRDITRLTDLEERLRERHQFHSIIGKNSRMKEIYGLIETLANTETTVLITGESGTGKELVANAIHYSGDRSNGPLIKVNCSALAENLLESELFGHVKGAFTGAVKDKKGRFQSADGGTILLDEIGDISQQIQLKLLRVLQDKVIERVGDSEPIQVNVRVLASTNCDLREKVKQGEFREDLFYRLRVMEIHLPSLSQRLDDLPLLIDHFCTRFNESFRKNIVGLSDKAIQVFMNHPWPGNIRELEHAIEHAFVVCRDEQIGINDLPPEFRQEMGKTDRPMSITVGDEQQIIVEALENTDWNKAKTARLLGISRQTLYRKMKQFHLKK